MSDYLKKRQELIFAGRPLKEKKNYQIPKVSEKRKAKMKAEAEVRGDGDTELQKFFKAAMKRMVGACYECGAKTETHLYKYAIFSICHILDKRATVCPSVAHDPNNWIELCPDHHTKFDNSTWEDIEDWGCWPEILSRLVMVEPNVAQEERRHLPEQLIKYIEKHQPF